MTRFEAAALLNACLDRVTEVTDELKSLMKEFEQELAILKGRVDGLEARVGELEATQFSTTTKLKGVATFVVGANSYSGNAEFKGVKRADTAAASGGATTFNYDLKLFLDTSFTGKDLLRTVLRSGNFGKSAFGGQTGAGGLAKVGLSTLEAAFEQDAGSNVVGVNRLFYQFPVGDSFTATAGAIVRQDDMLGVWPSAYPSDTVLDVFTYAGAPGAYNLALGSGAGLTWESDDFSITANYLSSNAEISDPEKGGLATNGAASNGLVQLAYAPENWGLAAAYNYSSGLNGDGGLNSANSTPAVGQATTGFYNLGSTNSLGLSAWWMPEESGWIPSVSTGWGLNNTSLADQTKIKNVTSQSWYVGLQWSDAFLKGNNMGMAVGQPTFVTSADFSSAFSSSEYIGDAGYAWEFWYQFQVTDNISVTPAIFYLSRPLGEATDISSFSADGTPVGDRDKTFSNFGGLIKTTFKF
jgi:hypothetical protein